MSFAGSVCRMSPRNHVLDRRDSWRHLANTVERLCAAGVATRPETPVVLDNFVINYIRLASCRNACLL